MNEDLNVYEGTLFDPSGGGELVSDGVIAVEDGTTIFAGSRDQFEAQEGLSERVKALLAGRPVEPNANLVIIPGFSDTHTHAFQPEGIPGVLIENKAAEGLKPDFQGWLPETLKFETAVRKDPELAGKIAAYRFEEYKRHGITSSLEYTTSSIEALRIVLEEAKKAGLEGRVKAGYVAMDQGVNFIEGVDLEVTGEEAQDAVIQQVRELMEEFPGQIVVIDRFTLAVSSSYRRKWAALAKEKGVLFETHAGESQGEFDIHSGMEDYKGRGMIEVLFEDGVFDPGMKVGLAHAIHFSPYELGIMKSAIHQDGVQVFARLCPDSNGNLGSHLWDGEYVPLNRAGLLDAGIQLTLGTDKGAGTGWSMAAEALKERARPHKGPAPTELELLQMATTNGSRSLGLSEGWVVGQRPNFIGVNTWSPHWSAVGQDRTSNRGELAARVLRWAQDPDRIREVVVNGQRLK